MSIDFDTNMMDCVSPIDTEANETDEAASLCLAARAVSVEKRRQSAIRSVYILVRGFRDGFWGL